MSKKRRKFADDGWAVWVDGDDTSTVYINDWVNPRGKSYVDIAVRIRGVLQSRALNVYIPFGVTQEEMDDVSLLFKDTKILQALTQRAVFRQTNHTCPLAHRQLIQCHHSYPHSKSVQEKSCHDQIMSK